MVVVEHKITKDTTVEELCNILDISFSDFYYYHITECIDRTKFWRTIEEDCIVLAEK